MGRAERGLKANALKAASFSLTPKGYIPVKSGQCDLLLISHTLKGIVGAGGGPMGYAHPEVLVSTA
jgi:hypothetical protein